MHAARLVIVTLLLIAVVVAYDPQVREQAVSVWDSLKPAVVEITDSLYVAIRNLIGNPSRDGVDDEPAPSPGGDFDRVVTMSAGFAL